MLCRRKPSCTPTICWATRFGGGALGITYRAVQLDAPARGRVVAVKEFFPRALAVRAADGSVQPMPKGAADFALYCAQFVHGYRVLRAKANCPALVPLLDLFEQNGTAYVVMAYIEGETLLQRVKAHGAIPPRALMRMMRPFLHDLAALHQRQIIHRAIMPENILLRGENPPMLLDFGGARPDSDGPLTRCASLRGWGCFRAGANLPRQTRQLDGRVRPLCDDVLRPDRPQTAGCHDAPVRRKIWQG